MMLTRQQFASKTAQILDPIAAQGGSVWSSLGGEGNPAEWLRSS